MFINEYGDTNAPKIILLAPMMISGKDIYNILSPHFKDTYCFIAPDQGGHGKAGNYISADEEYKTLKHYLLDNDYTDIDLLYGASLGVAVAYRLFNDPSFSVSHAWFDGVALKKHSSFAEGFMKRLFYSRKKTMAKKHIEVSKSLLKMYGEDFARIMTRNFERISYSDIDAICYACCHYELFQMTKEQQSRLHLEYGEKDFDLILSKKSIKKYFPYVQPVIRKGYGHCTYMAAHTEDYAKEIELFMSDDKR